MITTTLTIMTPSELEPATDVEHRARDAAVPRLGEERHGRRDSLHRGDAAHGMQPMKMMRPPTRAAPIAPGVSACMARSRARMTPSHSTPIDRRARRRRGLLRERFERAKQDGVRQR
jgi:hypothetical protein